MLIKKTLTLLIFPVVVLFLLSLPAMAGSSPSWWEQYQKAADQDGYQLIDLAEFRDWLDNKKESALLLDVRTPYEFEESHIEGAVNLEFHRGDRRKLDPAKAADLKKIIGSGLNRKVVVYCRSFR